MDPLPERLQGAVRLLSARRHESGRDPTVPGHRLSTLHEGHALSANSSRVRRMSFFWLGGLEYSSSPPTGSSRKPARRLQRQPVEPLRRQRQPDRAVFQFETSPLTSGSAARPATSITPNSALAPALNNLRLRYCMRIQRQHTAAASGPQPYVFNPTPGYDLGGTYVTRTRSIPCPGLDGHTAVPTGTSSWRSSPPGNPIGRHHHLHQGGHDGGRHAGLGVKAEGGGRKGGFHENQRQVNKREGGEQRWN